MDAEEFITFVLGVINLENDLHKRFLPLKVSDITNERIVVGREFERVESRKRMYISCTQIYRYIR